MAGWARPSSPACSRPAGPRLTSPWSRCPPSGGPTLGERAPRRGGGLREPAPADGAVVAVKPGDVDGACRAAVDAGAAGCCRSPPASPSPRSRRRSAAACPSSGPCRTRRRSSARARRPSPPARRRRRRPGLGRGDPRRGRQVVRVPEELLDAVTGLSGSGPAYVFLVAEALIDAGVLAGLPARREPRPWPSRPCSGAARLLAETGDGPEALRAAVTSPGGTTAAGLRALERAGVRAAFLDAVRGRHRAVPGARLRRSLVTPAPLPHQPQAAYRGRTELEGVMSHGAVPSAGPRFLTVAEVADQLRVSTMTVYRLIKAGELRAVRVGKSYRIARGRRRRATSPAGSPRRVDARAARSVDRDARLDTISFLSDYGIADEFVGVVQLGDPLDRARRRRDRRHPRRAPPTTSGPAALTLARSRAVPRPGVVLAVVDPGVGTDRRAIAVEVGDGRASWSGRTTACWRRRSPWSAGPPGPSSSPTPSTSCAAPGPPSRAATCSPRRPPTSAPACPSTSSAPAIDPITLLPGLAPAAPARRTARSWPRCCGSTASATPSSTSTPTRSSRLGRRVGCGRSTAGRAPAAPGARLRRARPGRDRPASSTPTACSPSSSTGARPPRSSASPPAPRSPLGPRRRRRRRRAAHRPSPVTLTARSHLA